MPPSGNDPEPPRFQRGAQTFYATTARYGAAAENCTLTSSLPRRRSAVDLQRHWCRRWELHPHDLAITGSSGLRVCYSATSALVLIEGVEPSRPCGHRLLGTARLPDYAISALVAARGVAPRFAACRAAVLLLDDAASVSSLLAQFIPGGVYSAGAQQDVACIGGQWRVSMVDLAGFEPATFPVRGGCAPCCATSPYGSGGQI